MDRLPIPRYVLWGNLGWAKALAATDRHECGKILRIQLRQLVANDRPAANRVDIETGIQVANLHCG